MLALSLTLRRKSNLQKSFHKSVFGILNRLEIGVRVKRGNGKTETAKRKRKSGKTGKRRKSGKKGKRRKSGKRVKGGKKGKRRKRGKKGKRRKKE